jgi:hypothetical protein
MSEVEEDQGSMMSAELMREHWGWDHKACIALCRTPARNSRGKRCPSCLKRVVIADLNGIEIEPFATRSELFAAWCGRMLTEFWQGITYPWRLDQARMRYLLEQAIATGLTAEVICPRCEAAEAGEQP